MSFNQLRLERFAVQAEKVNTEIGAWVDVEPIGAAMGLSDEETYEVAEHLRDIGWADFSRSTRPARLRLTLIGRREIAKLRRHPVVRWLEQHTLIASAIVSLVFGIIGALAIKLLEHWIGW